MADAIQENHEGTISHKFAKSGATMVNESNTLYVARMKGIDPALEADLFIVQLQISEKWDFNVIDLWNNEEMTSLYGTEAYNNYMHDEIHPNREGYVNWWTPVFEQRLKEILAARL